MSRRCGKIALIMPARNEEASVDETLEAVFRSTRLPDEIIVADGMSEDRTVERVRAFQERGVELRVVPNPSIYCGGGRNEGIRHCDCDIILIADFGNTLDPGWIEEMVRPFEEQIDVDIVAGMFRPLVKTDYQHCMGVVNYFHDYMLDRYTSAQKQSLVPKEILPGGLSIGITRRIWERAGGFPEWLPQAQDKMFSRKAYALGAKVAIAWNACLSHHMRNSPAAVFRQIFRYGRGNGRSRYIDRHVIKVMLLYSTLFALLWQAVGAWEWVLPSLTVLVGYLYKSGYRKLLKVDGGIRKVRYIWLVPAVLVPRDMGSLLGHVVGWWEWFFVPLYRRNFRSYTAGCDPSRLFVISP